MIAVRRNLTGQKFLRSIISLLIFGLLSSLFLVSYDIEFGLIDDLLVLIIGFFAFICIPGENLARLLLGKKKQMGVGLIVGILLNLIFIQILFFLSMLLQIQVVLRYWIVLCNVLFLAILLGVNGDTRILVYTAEGFKSVVKSSPNLIIILFIAIGIRLALAPIGLTSFAPDAGLYFDYARNINEGLFQSNIMNDGAVASRGVNVDEIAHHSTSYLYAISYMFMSGTQSNPIFFLVLFSILSMMGVYSFARNYFGDRTAEISVLLIAVHPTLVYFSVVGYGPELFSFTFLIFAVLLLSDGNKESNSKYILAGVLVAFVENIWFVNFYIVVFVLPLALIFSQRTITKEQIYLMFALVGALIARQVLANIFLFILIWMIIFMAFYVSRRGRLIDTTQTFPILIGYFLFSMFLYLPAQLSSIINNSPVAGIGLNGFTESIFTLPTFYYIAGGLFFLFWHLTPVLFGLLIIGLWMLRDNHRYQTFSLIALAISVGTGIILVSIEPMKIEYLYTTARFLISIIMIACILVGNILATGYEKYCSNISLTRSRRSFGIKQILGIASIGIILVGSLAPGYLALNANADFVNPEKRYAWQGLLEWVDANTVEGDRFLLDRAREFAWITNREGIYLNLHYSRDLEWEATYELLRMVNDYNADFLILDSYTVAHWNNFEFLQKASMTNENTLPLNAREAALLVGENSSEHLQSIDLLYQTQANSYGDYVRIFSVVEEAYSVSWRNISFSEDWDVSSGIELDGTRSEIHFLKSANSAIERNILSPFNITTSGGFVLFSFSEVNAEVTRISLINTQGVVIQQAERIEGSIFYAQLGCHLIGNIRIEMQGDIQGTISLEEMAIWQ
ncbi:MAG: glycosyltransferase family 39 protein [Candidatus Thorarchaeota archaeon]|nr:glycosyltransferase family 39 protein [Candidatus Thorarchaeota archaeon]